MQPTEQNYERAVRYGQLLKYVSEHDIPHSGEASLRALSESGYMRLRLPGKSRFADIRFHSLTYGHVCVEGRITEEHFPREDLLRRAISMFHHVYEQARRTSFAAQEHRTLLTEMARPLEQRLGPEVLGDDGAPLTPEHEEAYRQARSN